MHYTLSPAARRTLIALLIGVLLVWAFALWSFVSTVGSLNTNQLLPTLLMLVLSIAAPLVIWGMLEEYGAFYTLDDAELRFESYGLNLVVPWNKVVELDNRDTVGNSSTLKLTADITNQIANPLVRWLYTRLHGYAALPVYAGLEQRDELIAHIQTNTKPSYSLHK